ncbi:Brp/Blh family beta-carotene 15,15'-dioxygenase [uncultured Croceitalea sp.]|uniref:Brp/Blh family beta-carotene 15,15'-dioxygenase n=1 Tax=uncultured Croceitalea sp. TaxID=1798908 RepID=UPI003305B5C1
MKNWTIVATFFGLWISTMFEAAVQQVLAYALILTVGVLHGANDITLIRFSAKKSNVSFSFSSVLIYYMLTVLIVLVVFFIYPPLALITFVLISGYHFGEQHFKKYVTANRFLVSGLFLFYGLTILFMIFYFKMNKVVPILAEVMGVVLPVSFFAYGLMTVGCTAVMAMLWLTYKKQLKTNLLEELFYIVVLLVVFNTADLLWGFCIYFILWHSIPSLMDQVHVLYGSASKRGFIKYLQSSWVYWSFSIVGLVLLFLIFKNNTDFFVSVLIYFLAAITFPHVIVMSKIENT